MKLGEVADIRTGDKGNLMTISVTANTPGYYPMILERLTGDVVAEHLVFRIQGGAIRYEIPNVETVLFVCSKAAGDTVNTSLHVDRHGKTIGSALYGGELGSIDDENSETFYIHWSAIISINVGKMAAAEALTRQYPLDTVETFHFRSRRKWTGGERCERRNNGSSNDSDRAHRPRPLIAGLRRGGAVTERKTTSIRDVAERAGVSLGTVSNVLNRPETVATSTRRAVLAAIEELDYVRNASASRLRAKRSTVMGVLVVDYDNPFVTAYVESAEQTLATHGYSVVVAGTGLDMRRFERQLQLMEEFRVAGVVLPPIFIEELSARIDAMRTRGMAFAYVGGISPMANGCSTEIDQVGGGRLAGEHLIGIGRRRIVFVTGPRDLDFGNARLAGLRAAAEGHEDVSVDVVWTERLTGLAGHAATDEILAYDPDAVFCANDLTALGVLRGLIESGRRVPEDVALVGYDDISFAEIAAVPLTTIRQPAAAIGAAAAELLVTEVNETDHVHRHTLFAPELVVRQSSDSTWRPTRGE